jgi:propanol-preferring alcohol dehydrogenase
LKAWILTKQAPIEERSLSLVELPNPSAGDREIRIKVSYSGICRTDIHIAEGDLPLMKNPIILGHEVVGIVDQVGEDITQFQVGERVGAYWLHSACGQRSMQILPFVSRKLLSGFPSDRLARRRRVR